MERRFFRKNHRNAAIEGTTEKAFKIYMTFRMSLSHKNCPRFSMEKTFQKFSKNVGLSEDCHRKISNQITTSEGLLYKGFL